MGPVSGGANPTVLLWLLVLAATLAVQLHARGLGSTSLAVNKSMKSRSATATAVVDIPAALVESAAAERQMLQNNITGRLLSTLTELNAAAGSSSSSSSGSRSSSGTSDPRVLASIPLLLTPRRCKIQPATAAAAIIIGQQLGPGPVYLTGRPKAVTAGRAARLAAMHLSRQQQQEAAAVTSAGAAAAATATAAADPPAAYAEVLTQHNSYRAAHMAPALQWDEALASGAAAYAAQCVFGHDAATTSGESLFAAPAASSTDAAEAALAKAVKLWYDEVQFYDWNDPGYSTSTGHFTQLVWKGSSALGCAVQACSSGIANTPFTEGLLVICRYSPPGNVLGAAQFERNVLPAAAPPPQSSPPAPPLPPPTNPPAATLPGGYDFVSPGCLASANGTCLLCMQNDGNVVLFHGKQPVWASNTAHRSAFRPFRLTMQADGNLVATDKLRQAVWMTSTGGEGAAPYRLVVQGDGNAVIFDASSTAMWATHTAETPN